MSISRLSAISAVLALAATAGGAAPAAEEPPRLVLQITVDQLRGDMLPRLRDRFGEDGFRCLLERGTYFANAHYDTSNTVTSAGHATLVTGAVTAEHGMPANDWYDRASRRSVYCVGDPRYPVVGEPAKPDTGFSPANLTSSTIGDEIAAARPGARAFAVSGKDRSAVIPGGHAGKAFWFSEASGRFVTSTYYYPALPDWAAAWNDAKPWARYRELSWQPLAPTTPAAENARARPVEPLGRTFPHPLLAKSDALFFSALRYTPFLDELTAAFARELCTHEKLGQRGVTDYLSISFSATDYIGHAFGPESAEYQDNVLRLDRTLAELFRFLDGAVGLDHVLIVLAADHGIGPIPEEARAAGYDADRIRPAVALEKFNAALRRKFSVQEDLVAAFVPPGLYLDDAKLAAAQLDRRSAEQGLADEARALPGVVFAFTRSELLQGGSDATPLRAAVQRGFHPQRSGDVVIVQAQFWYLYPEPERYAAMHGSPYSYDTFVPLLLCGPGVPTATNSTLVTPRQLAPTLALMLGIKPPSGAVGTPALPGIR